MKTERKDMKGYFIHFILSFSREFFCGVRLEFGRRTLGYHLHSRTIFFMQSQS